MTCTFFGHRSYNGEYNEKLKEEIEKLIKEGVKDFLVGHNGGFDSSVKQILKELKKQYTDIRYTVVLSRLDKYLTEKNETVFPDGIENALPRFKIIYRNNWMINNSDIVISYVRNSLTNGASSFTDIARRKGKRIISI